MRNRFYKTPHCSSFGSDWPGTQAHFRAMAAEGGWAAISTEYCSIHPSSDGNPSVGARLWDDTDVRNLGLMCERIHEHGSLAGVQLWYGAAHARNYESRMPAARRLPDPERLPLRPVLLRARPPRDPRAPGASTSRLRSGRGQPASTSSTSTAATATRSRGSSSTPSTTGAPTSTAAPSRTGPASGSRRSSR